MLEIARFDGEDLDTLVDRMRLLVEEHDARRLSSVSFAVDGGLKVKAVGHNLSSTWTPPLGRSIS